MNGLAGGQTGEDAAVPTDDAGGGDLTLDLPVIRAPGLFAASATGTGSGWISSVSPMEDSGVVVVGTFAGTLTFAEGRQLTSRGEHDAFVARYRKDGTVAWLKQIGDLGYDAALNVTAVGYNEVAVIGFFYGSTIVEEQTSTHPPLVLISSGAQDQDCFIARLASDGSTRWAKRIGGPGQETCRAGAGTALGEVFLTGAVGTGAVFGGGEVNEHITAGLEGPIFTALYGSDGSLRWVRFAGGQANGQGFDITLLGADPSPVVAGFFGGTAVFGSGDSAISLPQQGGAAFAARYAHDGTLMWAKQMAGAKGGASSIDADADGTMLVLGGRFEITGTFGQLTLHEGSLAQVGWLARMRPDGTTASAVKLSGVDPGKVRWLRDGGIAMTASFGGALVFGPTTNGDPGTMFRSRGEGDVLVMRYDLAGTLRWITQVGGPRLEFPGGLVQTQDGALWSAGQGASMLTLSSPGASDVQVQATQDGSPFLVRLTEAQ